MISWRIFTLLSLLILCLSHNSFGQINKIDSLKVVLNSKRVTKSDTLRVNALLELGRHFLIVGDSALIYNNEALSISKKQKWKKGIYKSYKALGVFYFSKNRLMKSVDCFYEALKYVQTPSEQATIYRFLGDAYSLLEDFEKSRNMLEKSMKVFKKENDRYNYLYSQNNLSLVYYDMKDYSSAERLLRSGLALNNGEYEDLDYFFEFNLGLTLLEKADYDEALRFFQKSLVVSKSLNKYSLIITYCSIADIYFRIGDLNLAKQNLKKAENALQNYDLKNDGFNDIDKIAYKIYALDGNYNLAFNHLQRYWDIKSEKTKQESTERIAALEIKYLHGEKEKEVLELQRKRTLTLVIVSMLIIILIILIFFYKKIRANLKLVKNQKQKLTELSVELNNLNSDLEIKVKERTEKLLAANIELRQKNEEIVKALFEGKASERIRISQELHDNLGGMITVLNFQMQSIELDNIDEANKEKLINLKKNIGKTYNELRFISHNLLPHEFEKIGLLKAIEQLSKDVYQQKQLEVVIKNQNFTSAFTSSHMAFELYAITLEAINNVLKHAHASQCLINIKNSTIETCLIVQDNGTIQLPKREEFGYGLNSISNRVKKMQGSLKIEGKALIITIPNLNQERLLGNI